MADTPRRASWVAAALALAALAAGCGPRSVALYEKVMGSPSYGKVTESATRTREVHDGLDTRFILSATWLSGPWVSSFAEEYSNIYYLDAARREQVVSRWREESERYVRFFVALYVPEEKGNDLEKPGTLWSLRSGPATSRPMGLTLGMATRSLRMSSGSIASSLLPGTRLIIPRPPSFPQVRHEKRGRKRC